MFKKFSAIFTVFIILFLVLVYFFYQKANEIIITNSEKSIEELLVNYNSIRDYVSNYQKEEIYDLQMNGTLTKDYFHPVLLSSTFSAKMINNIYNEKRKQKGLEPIEIKFASSHPRNPQNLATPLEKEILDRMNKDPKIENYSSIIVKDDKEYLLYAVRTKKTTSECMRCHSDPAIAPKGLVEYYGDTNGFWEKVGIMRSVLVTTYPLEEEKSKVYATLYLVYFITFIVFSILLYIVYRFMQKIETKNVKLEYLNSSLDKIVQKRTKELDKEKNYLKNILDINPNIIIVTNGKIIQSANRSFFEFFEFNSIESFKKEHKCVCEYFESINNIPLDQKTFMVDGVWWIDFIRKSDEKVYTVELLKNQKKYYFFLTIANLNDDELLITLQDITASKDKEKLIIQQSKMASMGEMLSNIAHQWRQPLSMISTLSTGVSIQSEYGMLTNDKLHSSMDKINESAQFLSSTIDDFTNFFRADKNEKYFKSSDMIEMAIKLHNNVFKTLPIIIEREILIEDIFGFENELTQVVLNIVTNASEILMSKESEIKVIKIKVEQIDKNIVISIHDNGGGVPSEIKDKIFDPYFTTKHQSQGTGMGLYTSYELINLHMGGDLSVENELLSYARKEYLGANFKIKIPQKNIEKKDMDRDNNG